MFERPVMPPLVVPEVGGLLWKMTYPNGKPTLVALNAQESTAAMTALTKIFADYISVNSDIQNPSQSDARYLGQTWVPSGIIIKQPTDRVTMVSTKNGISNDEFWERSRRGEIVVSDYERAGITVRQSAGMTAVSTSEFDTKVRVSTLLEQGLLSKVQYVSTMSLPGIPGSDVVLNIGWNAGKNYPTGTVFRYRRSTVNGGEWSFHDEVDAQVFLSACRSLKPEFKGLVTDTLAKANRSSLDVLTALAEAPKTVLSLMSALKQVAQMLKDIKKGQFDLNKAHAISKSKKSRAHKKRMERIKAELRRGKLSSKRKLVLESHLKKVDKAHQDFLTRSADELASSLANQWLNYRYNIMTNVYLAQDVFDAATLLGREWITASGFMPSTTSIDVGLPGKTVKVRADQILRVLIKRNFSANTLNKAESVISNDIFVTAWELVPLSFVYDWFVNIGDLLSAQSYKTGWDQEGATKSIEIKLGADIDMPTKTTYVIEPTTHVEGFYYSRKVINPIDECGLVWQPTVGLERKLDLISLAWRPVRSLLLKGKKQ